jgi:uncharacterized protein YhbP (UPF0306 family)
MDPNQIAREYIKSAHVMQLATVAGNKPWLCTVHYVVDKDWNFYWLSIRNRRHSLELATNPKVAVTIVRDPAIKHAIQMEGEATEVPSDQLESIHTLYSEKHGQKESRLIEAKSGKIDQRTYYCFKPSHLQMFDEVDFPTDPVMDIVLT